jgi:NitT/TauT family transport system ATP-binding protein
MTGAIAIDKVSKRFPLPGNKDGVLALSELSLDIAPGEFVAILGPSGCGKSTLLRLVASLEQPTAGKVSVNGAAPNLVSGQHALGVAFQDHALLPWLTVHDNIALPFKIAGRRVDEPAITRLIELVGLKSFAGARPRQLSGGMRQRASIARALVLEPQVLLLDEPFGALDAQTRMGLHHQLLELWREKRSTMLFITHDLVEAITLSDEIVVMTRRPGRVKELYHVPLARPRNVFEIYLEPGFDEAYAALWKHFKSEISVTSVSSG